MDRIVHVNTRENTVSIDECSSRESALGGRAFIADHLLHNVDPKCDPLGRHNRLILASGLLGDANVTTAGRFSIGGKSPLTHGVKESNVGGAAGQIMARLGYRAVILEDAPEKGEPRVLLVKRGGAELIPEPELKHKVVSKTFSFLKDKYGSKAGYVCIGPAGEMGLTGSCVAVTDHTGVQVRVAGRGGLGAVMGSKGIKAVVFDGEAIPSAAAHNKEELVKANRELSTILREDPKTENRHDYGTPAVLALCNSLGILPTRNFSSGEFESADDIAGEMVAKLILNRKGEGQRGLPCVKGCVIQCSNIFPDPSGKKIVASLQYENIALLGSNCGIGNIDDIAELNNLCNEVGVDTIETGAAVGVAMEAGVISFGDAEGAKDLIRQIGEGTYLGRILGNGAAAAGRVLGVRRVPVIKGQAIPAYDPRSLKGIGVTYVMSPMGADHTAGNTLETVKYLDPLKTEGQVEISYRLQVRGAILDSLGVCLFIRPAFVKDPELAARLLNARYGWSYRYRDVQAMGKECLENEREFNRRSGALEGISDVPEFMRDEALPPKNTVYNISKEEMEHIWKTELPDNIF